MQPSALDFSAVRGVDTHHQCLWAEVRLRFCGKIPVAQTMVGELLHDRVNWTGLSESLPHIVVCAVSCQQRNHVHPLPQNPDAAVSVAGSLMSLQEIPNCILPQALAAERFGAGHRFHTFRRFRPKTL